MNAIERQRRTGFVILEGLYRAKQIDERKIHRGGDAAHHFGVSSQIFIVPRRLWQIASEVFMGNRRNKHESRRGFGSTTLQVQEPHEVGGQILFKLGKTSGPRKRLVHSVTSENDVRPLLFDVRK